MASNKRGGPPDLRSTLSSFLRTTLEQVSVVRDVAYQQTRSGGGLLNQALMERKRNSAYAKLGEAVHQFAKRGELGELMLEPEIAVLLGEIDELDQDEAGLGLHDQEAVSSADYASSPRQTPESEEYRVWRPVAAQAPPLAEEETLQPPSRSSGQAPMQGGGIHFGKDTVDDGFDDDLETYMHDDDVP